MWKFAYAHNKNGKPTKGNLGKLRRSIRRGRPVRVLVEHARSHEYVTDAQCLWLKGKRVYAQNTSHVSVMWDGPVLKFKDNSYWYMITLDTDGHYDVIRWNVGEHKPGRRDHLRLAMKWFVEY